MGQAERALSAVEAPVSRRVWLVRLGRTAAAEQAALSNGLVTFDAGVREDLSDALEYEDVFEEVLAANPSLSSRRVEALARQLHLLLHDIIVGDLVLCPLKSTGTIAVGIFRADHGQDGDGKPGRRVDWLAKALPRSALLPDLLYSLNAKQNVAEISRNDCARRLEAVIGGELDPGPSGGLSALPADPDVLERLLRQRLVARMGAVFAGHGLADLVGEILKAKGYQVRIAPPGPDGGVDIYAGTGRLAMEERLIVQVKSGDQRVGAEVLQQLEGAMRGAKVDQGLLVSWGGITRQAARRMQERWHEVRFWAAGDLVEAFLECYEDLPLHIRDQLPLRKAWVV